MSKTDFEKHVTDPSLGRDPASTYSPPPLHRELLRIGIAPLPADPRWLGRPPRDGEKSETVLVAGRVSPTTKRLVTKIVERRLVPGVSTVSDAVHAALFLWTRLLENRIRDHALSLSHLRAMQLKESYDTELEAQKSEMVSHNARGFARLALNRDDLADAVRHLFQAKAYMSELQPNVAARFEATMYGTGIETDPVGKLWGEVMSGKWAHLDPGYELDAANWDGDPTGD